VVFAISLRWFGEISPTCGESSPHSLLQNRSTMPMRRDFTHSGEIMTIVGEISPHFAELAVKQPVPVHDTANSCRI